MVTPTEQPAVQPYRIRCATRKAELGAALDRLIQWCAQTADVDALVVFGSYARNRVSPWSDLDVLVVRRGGPPDLVDDIYRAWGGGDVIGMRAEDYPAQLTSTPFGRTILREGTIVYARPD